MIICLGPTPAIQRVMVFKTLTLDHVNRAAQTLDGIAGKAVNTAKVVHSLSQSVHHLGFAGGQRGRFLGAELQKLSLSHDLIAVEPETRLCVTLLDQSGQTQTELVEETQPVNPTAYDDLFSRLQSLLPKAKVLCLSGTLTPAAPIDFYYRCAQLASAHHVPTIIDTQGQVLLRSLDARPFMVKPNRHELGVAMDMPVESEAQVFAAIDQLLHRGVGSAIITMGAAGALAANGSLRLRLRVPGIQTINPIGSGDAVTAGIAVGLARKLPFAECCRLGLACGTANALTLLAGQVFPQDVDSLLPQITSEII